MSKLYKNSPIIEAACNFSFTQESSWNATIPGQLYVKLQQDYPEVRHVQDFESLWERADADKEAQQPTLHHRINQISRTQFVSSDGGWIIQVQPFALSVNRIAPYTSWAEFSPKIKFGLSTYRDVVNPKNIRGIQLQYQNKIVVPGPLVHPEDFFNFHYAMPPNLGGRDTAISNFLIGVQMPFDDGMNQLKLQLSTLPSEDADSVAFLLQLVCDAAKPDSISLDNIDQWLDTAHDNVEKAFESSISDKLRIQFEEVAYGSTYN